MIVTVTLNPSVDISYEVEKFQQGGIFRARESQQTAGGKGLNVTRVLKQLDVPVIATGFLGGKNGEFIQEQLEREKVASSFIEIKETTRSCIAILEKETQTEVLGPGPWVKEEEIKGFLEGYSELVKKAELICISGSLPRGVPQDFYRDLVKIAGDSHCRVLLDSSGAPLAEGVKGTPYLLKPNLEEMESLLGKGTGKKENLEEGLRDLIKTGIQVVCLSMGGDGALIMGREEFFRVEVPAIKAENPVGSGDAMLAGWAYGLLKGYNLEKASVFATACGISNALEKKTGRINPHQLEEISGQVKIVPLNRGRKRK